VSDLRVTAPLSNPHRARRALDDLRERDFNFDLSRRDEFTAVNGWKVDHYRQPLPPEPPGEPLARGSWWACTQLMADYEFADPAIVRAIFRSSRPLEGRDMLLEGRFLGLRFLLGLRIGEVVDDTTELQGRTVRRWGWNYRTLQGHLEQGQMDYTVLKWLDDGTVEFRIDAFSQPAHIPNPIVRVGFAVFGRLMQRLFARAALARMRHLVRDELVAQATGVPRSHGTTRTLDAWTAPSDAPGRANADDDT
jgi:uncharacterized protein (UPF0548 family)